MASLVVWRATMKKVKLTKKELERFKKLLLKQREVVCEDINSIEQEAATGTYNETSGELSNVPVHLADISAENYEQEFAVGLLENKGEVAALIDEALRKIEEGTYGICEMCGGRIKKTRLQAIPYAQHCIECQRKIEEGEEFSKD